MSATISSKFGHGGPRANSGGPRENSGGVRPGAGRPWKTPEAPVIIPTRSRWCVYQTHPQAERLAAEDLTRTGYHGYAPLIAVRRQDAVIRSLFHKIRVPRFPGYGFVELGPGDPWLPILEATGVARLLRGLDGRPACIPAGELERHMADDDRLCDLARETMTPFTAGDRVLILEGAFFGHEGSVIECDGLCTMVELMMFRRPMPYRADRASVEAV
jgi:transcription antitermination factor NusG